MTRKISAFYSSFRTANSAARELAAYGLPRDGISVVAASASGAYGFAEKPMNTGVVVNDALPDERRAGTRIGGGIGVSIGLISGMLVGSGAWPVPGLDLAGLASFGLAVLFGGAGLGIFGGIFGRALGALIGLGIPEEEAEQYAESVRQSGVLVAVSAEEYNAKLIREVLERFRPFDITDKTFDESAPAWEKLRDGMQPAYAQEWEQAQRR